MSRLEWTSERVDQLKSLHAEGYSGGQIASLLGITRSTVMGKLFRMKMPCSQSTGAGYIKLEQRDQPPRKPRAAARRLSPFSIALRRAAFEPRRPNEHALNIGLLDLQPNACHFPTNDQLPFLFCGQPAVQGISWCAQCARVVFLREVA